MNYILEKNGAARMLVRIPGLVYAGAWVVYLLAFALGGMALPAPTISLGNIAGNAYALSLWSIPGWGLVISLLYFATRQFPGMKKWKSWIHDRARRPMLVLATWAILHNLCYMLFLPVPGTASRYGAINYLVLWFLLVKGLVHLVSYPRLLLGLAGGLATIAVANTIYWNGVYDANIDHMQKVRIAAAYYVRDTFPPDEQCAAFDVGAVRYFSQRPILDLGGLVDPDLNQWFLAGSIDQYLANNHVTCLVLPGRTGRVDEGWFDFARMMGLTDSSLFAMDQVNVFEIHRERWLQGYLPTGNYQASVTIYRLELQELCCR